MISLLSKINIIDNSGALEARCIKVLKPGKPSITADIGDVIIVSILKTSTHSKINKGDVHKAIIVRTTKKSNMIKWDTNAGILVKGTTFDPIATRIKGPISKRIKQLKILSLAKIQI